MNRIDGALKFSLRNQLVAWKEVSLTLILIWYRLWI
jgi:hypothetical protein